MRDERLNLAFEHGRVKLHEPPNSQEWFKILVIHQNKFKGNFIGASRRMSLECQVIPDMIDLVIWGHEHECIKEPW